MNKKILPIIIIGFLIGGIGGFLGGIQYQKSKDTGTPQRGNFQGTRAGNLRFGTNGGAFANGQIISMDSKSVTLKLNNSQSGQVGGSKIIFFSNSTEVGKFVIGTPNDLKVGDSVIVTGTQNSDGSMSATSLQIRPVPTGVAQ